MRILFLAPYPPYPPHSGGQQRMYHILRQLAPRHELHLLTFAPADDAAVLEPLREFCSITPVVAPARTTQQRLLTTLGSARPDMLWRGYSPAFAATLRDLLAATPFDVVQAESIEMTQYGAENSALPDIAGSPAMPNAPLWVYDAFNIEYIIQQRAFQTDIQQFGQWHKAAYSLIQWYKLKHWERRLPHRFAGAFTVSEGDRAALQTLAPTLPTTVVPNGVDAAYFAPLPSLTAAPNVLFTGTLDYRPNVDAVLWFADEVWPLILMQQPDARFVVAGRTPVAAIQNLADRPGITITGSVADMRPFFAQAAVYVIPMRIGGGVRLKLLEAFAQGLPVVSSPLGVEGVDGFRPDIHALIADDAPAFADTVLRLLHDRPLAHRLGAAAHRLAADHYEWQMLIPRMEQAWHDWAAPPADESAGES